MRTSLALLVGAALLALAACANNPPMKPAAPIAEKQPVAGWVYLLRLSRPDLLETATEDEAALFAAHFAYLQDLTRKGVVIVAGPSGAETASPLGIAVFEAPDEAAARAIMEGDPAVKGGVFTAELRSMRLSLLRERDMPRR